MIFAVAGIVITFEIYRSSRSAEAAKADQERQARADKASVEARFAFLEREVARMHDEQEAALAAISAAIDQMRHAGQPPHPST